MYLSELQIVGFKSFAQKLNLEFGDGITAIVGPNGCGKTNIVDAIRWVLGEQRPSILRTDRMEEVIFNGSNGRKSLGMAEVSLKIENTKNILPIEFSQVQITRRLFRSGESDYLLNKTSCRHKDIIDLFLDTGMGAHAYSVIELSMVDDILSDRAEARRRLFDEASGVMKYKVRRHEAMNKLRATEADLLRISDIVSEVEKKVRSLKYQVGKARRFETYKDRLRNLEIASAKREREAIHRELGPLQEHLSQFQEEQERITEHIAQEEETLQHLRTQYQSALRERSQLQVRIQEYADAMHKVEESLSVARERVRSLEERIERNSEETKGLHQRMKVTGEQKIRSEKDLVQVSQDLVEQRKAHSESQKKLSDSDKTYVQHKIAAAQGERKIAELLPLFAEQAKELDHLKAQYDMLHARKSELEQEKKRVQTSTEELDRNILRVRGELEETHKTLQKMLVTKGECEKKLHTLERDRKQSDEALWAVNSESASLQAKLRVLEQSLDEGQGYSAGVKYIVSHSPRIPGVRAVFGDILEIPSELTKALQVALGSVEQYILTDNTAAALKAVHQLRESEKGCAYFLPLDAIPRREAKRFDPATLKGNGFVGWATDLVSCSHEFHRAKEFLLRDIIVVEDVESALAFQHNLREMTSIENGYTVVTLDGTLVRSGVIGGGTAGEGGDGLIGRRAEVEQLNSQLRNLRITLDERKKRHDEIQAKCDRTLQEIESLNGHVEEHRIKVLELEKSMGNLELQKSGLRDRSQSLGTSQETLVSQAEELSERIRLSEARVTEIEQEKKEAESCGRQLRSELSEYEAEKEAKTKEVQELNLKVVSLQWRCNQLKEDIQRLGEIEKDIKGTLQRKVKETSEAKSEIEQLQCAIAEKNAELETLLQKNTDLKERLSTQGEAYTTLEQDIEACEEEIRGLRLSEQETRERVHDSEMKISDLEHRARHRKERILDEYGIDVDAAELSEDFDVEHAPQSIERLKEKIRHLGPVNLLALKEYEEEHDRFEFLASQRNDLLEAKESLKETITEINRTARKRFTKTYTLIRKNFRETFLQFFGKGQANLQLTPGVDPLEADIEIRACTRGTIPGSIDAFSGGEKTLTAISLLFAIYLVKPSPFCILDEIDAPLDDANVVRFSAALKEFAKSTQFIVVTHNKKTMEGADRLYGVTMEEEGISKLVSVKFEEAA
ncbi:MAG: chromosome segregation protein SMC [Gemmatimonadota bacterium]|nr:MAG: chromosome segregation protein SMC [Gemmatimonadota bacterium]